MPGSGKHFSWCTFATARRRGGKKGRIEGSKKLNGKRGGGGLGGGVWVGGGGGGGGGGGCEKPLLKTLTPGSGGGKIKERYG